jgi:hypothetical protein
VLRLLRGYERQELQRRREAERPVAVLGASAASVIAWLRLPRSSPFELDAWILGPGAARADVHSRRHPPLRARDCAIMPVMERFRCPSKRRRPANRQLAHHAGSPAVSPLSRSLTASACRRLASGLGMLALLPPLASGEGCGGPEVGTVQQPSSVRPPSVQPGAYVGIQTPSGLAPACAYWLYYSYQRALVQQGDLRGGEFSCTSDDHEPVGSKVYGFFAITDATPNSLLLFWRGPPSDVPAYVLGVRIERSDDEGGSWFTVFGSEEPCGSANGYFRDTGLTPGASYYYRIGDFVTPTGVPTTCYFQPDANMIGAIAHG